MLLTFVPAPSAAPTRLVEEAPASISRTGDGNILVDFERVAFGNIMLTPNADAHGTVTVHFGEALTDGRVERKPPGTVRYQKTRVRLSADAPTIAAPRADSRNTTTRSWSNPPAILTPPEWDVVLPFRWVEIEGWEGELRPGQITRRAAYASAWDDNASAFESSDELLNRIWELSKYSIKATTFAGVYVDGDRERIPYEADAYLNQLSHYATDNDKQMARDTFDHLMQHGTWPTEWAPHMVFMAYADWMHTGNVQWLVPRYEALKDKLLLERTLADGLVGSNKKQIKRLDIVDWPKDERDGYVFTSVNTVVNAFHLRALRQMAALARAVGKNTDAEAFASQAQKTHVAFQEMLFRPDLGIYRDGINTDHSSLHANLFPLAFELVPEDEVTGVVDWVEGRGMACSVYAAQYLLEGLFENGAGTAALNLITADGDRSWRHMVESGATITWEAWDLKYKPNQDWNHAWGAAPANLLPRYVLGAQPQTPGWGTARIRPTVGNLAYARGKVPTPLGPVLVAWSNGQSFQLALTLPANMTAIIEIPAQSDSDTVTVNGESVMATRAGNYWVLNEEVAGAATVEIK